jgi:hypothetical protein
VEANFSLDDTFKKITSIFQQTGGDGSGIKIVISGKSMRVRPESVTHIVVKLFNVKSKFDYIDKNKQKSEIANNDKFEFYNTIQYYDYLPLFIFLKKHFPQ